MCRDIHISLDDLKGHLVDPPIVDALHFEPTLRGFVVTFVPDEYASSEPTETVVIKADSPEGRRVAARLMQLANSLGDGADIARITHAGGGNFTFHFKDGAMTSLDDSRHAAVVTVDAIHCLQDIAQAAEIAFRLAMPSIPS